MNQVILVGKLTRDPEVRTLASGKVVTTFTLATVESGSEKFEYSPIVVWDKLAEICGHYLSRNQTIALTGKLQTRSWDDETGRRHWKTEVVAEHVELLSGAGKKDFAAGITKEEA